MDRIRQLVGLLKKWKTEHYSIMIIPNAGGSVRQVRIQALCVYAALFLGISAGLFFITSSLVLIRTNFTMVQINTDMSQQVSSQESAITTLSSTNDKLVKENSTLRQATAASTDTFNQQIEEVNRLQQQMETLMALFNKQNRTDIHITTSRSGGRTAPGAGLPTIPQITSIENDQEMAAVSALVQKNAELYSQLIAQVEAELKALDSRPDFWPARGRITSRFGFREDPFNRGTKPHEGIDIDNVTGTPIWAAGAGVVTFNGTMNGFGKMIVVSHGSGYETVYAHLDSSSVQTGDTVKKGEVIGAMGSSGRSTGSHLHFEVHRDGALLNPENVLSTR